MRRIFHSTIGWKKIVASGVLASLFLMAASNTSSEDSVFASPYRVKSTSDNPSNASSRLRHTQNYRHPSHPQSTPVDRSRILKTQPEHNTPSSGSHPGLWNAVQTGISHAVSGIAHVVSGIGHIVSSVGNTIVHSVGHIVHAVASGVTQSIHAISTIAGQVGRFIAQGAHSLVSAVASSSIVPHVLITLGLGATALLTAPLFPISAALGAAIFVPSAIVTAIAVGVSLIPWAILYKKTYDDAIKNKCAGLQSLQNSGFGNTCSDKAKLAAGGTVVLGLLTGGIEFTGFIAAPPALVALAGTGLISWWPVLADSALGDPLKIDGPLFGIHDSGSDVNDIVPTQETNAKNPQSSTLTSNLLKAPISHSEIPVTTKNLYSVRSHSTTQDTRISPQKLPINKPQVSLLN